MSRQLPTVEQAEAKQLRDGVLSRTRRLRSVIDQIERSALQAIDDAVSGQGRYARVAEIFIKEISEAAVNAGLDGLVYYAAQADVIREQELNEREV